MRKVKTLEAMANNAWCICKVWLRSGFRLLNTLMPYICLVIGAWLYSIRGGFIIGLEWLLPAASHFVKWALEYVSTVGNDQLYGMPVARKRFTRRDELGQVVFKNSDVYEIAEYLCEVEEYCEKYGKYKGGR